MTIRRLAWRLMLLLLVLMVAAPAAAQPNRGGQGRGVAPRSEQSQQPTDNMSPAQLHELFDAMLVMQAQRALSLDEQQYAQFLTRVQTLQETRRRHQQERLRLISELQRLSNPRNAQQTPEPELKSRLNALQELESRAAADLRRSYDAVDEVLNPLQQARFRVLEEQIERRKLELVGRARQNNQKRPPPAFR